ncbi:competence type IV pilus minor pilin ComGG [Alicyclobacillus pomorum]|uniref:competence type IV pilus minor pilin ComGG n=1 Tax=Alicyclobacillus pomorum TaxID=204470 RepID=UPI0003F4AE13|nr:competence type IV pilus minor pilin ComGG [Alicyclobacillus pomorum]
MWTYIRNHQRGDVLLFTMGVLLLMTLVCAGMATVVTYCAQIETLKQQHQEVYWLARGHAIHLLEELSAGHEVPAHALQAYGEGTVETAVTRGTVWTVKVTAKTSQATDVIQFCYDSGRKKVVDWKENLPVTMDNSVS